MAEDYPRTLVELERRFSDDAACRQYLFALRWPAGFRCPRCQRENAWPISRGLWLCTGCRTQVSVLAGTVFQDTHLPLTVWFRAMWHMTSQKNGMSALGLQRVLGLGSYKTAWLMLQSRTAKASVASAWHESPISTGQRFMASSDPLWNPGVHDSH